MKKRFGIVLIIACSMCTSCSLTNETSNFSSDTNDTAEQDKSERKSGVLVEDYNMPVNEETIEISLSSQYDNYTYFVAVDDDWYYYADYDNRNQYIKISINNPEQIIELQGFESEYDFTIEYAYHGKLYINIFDYEDLVCHYKLLEISENQPPKTVLSGEGRGYPEMNFGGRYLAILNVDADYRNNLDIYDMETQEMTHVYDCTGIQHEDWSVDGEVINGLSWSKMLPSDEGFCFMVSEMNGQSFEDREDGTDRIYYYSFESGKLRELLEVKCLADYVGGTDEAILVSGGHLGDANGPKLYVKNGMNYDAYSLVRDDSEFIGYIGSGILEDGRFVAYDGDYYVVVDLEDKGFIQNRFVNLDSNADSSGSDAANYVHGIYYYDKSFYFSVIEDGVIKLHIIK